MSSLLPPGVGVLDFFRPPFLKLGEGVLLSLFPMPGEALWVLGDLVLALELQGRGESWRRRWRGGRGERLKAAASSGNSGISAPIQRPHDESPSAHLDRDPWLSELNEGDGGLNPEDLTSLWSPLIGWCDDEPCRSMAWEGAGRFTYAPEGEG